MKRMFDFAAALIGLLVGAVAIAAMAVAVRMESIGNPIFAQTRVGRHGRPFTCYKLRTMYDDTAELPTHRVNASAVTPIGARLRRWKLDELPQLFNVLAGDMSLVGPRPCLPSQLALIEARRRRGVLNIRPGITGLAQVRGVDMSDPEKLATLDAQYVQEQSFMGDLHLLIATVAGKGRGKDQVR